MHPLFRSLESINYLRSWNTSCKSQVYSGFNLDIGTVGQTLIIFVSSLCGTIGGRSLLHNYNNNVNTVSDNIY